MITVAVVDDEQLAADGLKSSLEAFGARHGEEFSIVHFTEATAFLEGYRPIYDIVFMDIEMPHLNGMDAARRLRAMDGQVVLMFVTNISQFAAKGYEVDALDYIVKPYAYADFERKLKRAVRLCHSASESVVVNRQGGTARVLLREIEYIEVSGHSLILHTEGGTVRGAGTLAEMEDKLGGKGFLRCSKAFLVNHRHVRAVEGSVVTMTDGTHLSIGRTFKKPFMVAMAEHVGQANVI